MKQAAVTEVKATCAVPQSTNGAVVWGQGRKWYWHLQRAGRIVADGTKSYTRRADAIRACRGVLRWLGDRKVTMFIEPSGR